MSSITHLINNQNYMKKKQRPKMIFYFLLLTISFGLLNALICKINSKTYKVATQVEKPLQSPNLALQTASSSEMVSNLQIIYTKTQFFDNEVQVWLASEAACKSVGLGTSCINDLMAIAYTETRSFNYKAMGDGNKSYGAFQIHLGYHPEVTIEQATDPYWAAKWTIKRLLAKGYLKDRNYAIMSHNGTPGIPATKGYLATVNKYLAMK